MPQLPHLLIRAPPMCKRSRTSRRPGLKKLNAKDADKFASYFAEDGSALYPGAGILNGKAAIKAPWHRILLIPIFQ